MTRHDTKTRGGFHKEQAIVSPYDATTPGDWRPDPTDTAEALDQIRELFNPLNEPTGLPNRTDSTLSWVGGTRTFTITPASTSFDYYVGGLKYTVSAADSIVIADTGGVHIIYYDGATLSESVNPAHAIFDDIWLNKAAVGIVYWNATDGTAHILADERHGGNMSGATHRWVHDAIGAFYKDGLTLSGYTEDSDVDADLTFEVSDGSYYDDDIEHEITDGTPANQYEQQLNGADAEIPIAYRDDNAGGIWTQDAATTLPYKTGGSGRLAYNKDDGDGTFSQVEVTDGKWVSATLIATNDWQYPIKMIQGQNEYTDKKTALESAAAEILSWGSMLSPEIKVLYRLVMQTKDTFGSTPKCKISADGVIDLRRAGLSGAAAVSTSHLSLADVGPDDHHDRSHAVSSTSDHTAGNWKTFHTDGSGEVQELTVGAANKLLLGNGATSAPTWGDLPAKWRTVAKMLYAEDPQAGDVYPIDWVAYAVTFLQVRGITDVGTVTFNIERRVITTPATIGTDILDTGGPADPDLVAAVGGAVTTTFAAAGVVAADQWLVATITSVAAAPTKLWIPYKYSID